MFGPNLHKPEVFTQTFAYYCVSYFFSKGEVRTSPKFFGAPVLKDLNLLDPLSSESMLVPILIVFHFSLD